MTRQTLVGRSREPVRRATSTIRSNPALVIPLLGGLLLVYLVVFPLIMLVLGSFQEEVAPRQFDLTLRNYADAYTSRFTYSTFATSAIFASGAAEIGRASCRERV